MYQGTCQSMKFCLILDDILWIGVYQGVPDRNTPLSDLKKRFKDLEIALYRLV